MALEIDHIRQITERVAASHGLEVVDLEFRGGGKARMLRIFIDKPQGVTHQDCESVSREVGAILDVEDAVPGGSYTLEVSSPGLDRRLSKPADYERFTGSRLKVQTREPIEGDRFFEGRLESFRDGTLTVAISPTRKERRAQTKGEAAEKILQIELANVEKASLVPEF